MRDAYLMTRLGTLCYLSHLCVAVALRCSVHPQPRQPTVTVPATAAAKAAKECDSGFSISQ
jgi:hypothetical protein